MSSLVDEPPKKKVRAKSKVDPAFPLRRFAVFQPYIPILTQNSEAGKSSKRPKPSSHILSKDEETIKRLKVLISSFVGLVHASYSLDHLTFLVPRRSMWRAKAVDTGTRRP